LSGGSPEDAVALVRRRPESAIGGIPGTDAQTHFDALHRMKRGSAADPPPRQPVRERVPAYPQARQQKNTPSAKHNRQHDGGVPFYCQ